MRQLLSPALAIRGALVVGSLLLASCVTKTYKVLPYDYPRVMLALSSLEKDVKAQHSTYRDREFHLKDSWAPHSAESKQPPRLEMQFSEGWTSLGTPQRITLIEVSPHAAEGTRLDISVRESGLFHNSRKPELEEDWLKRILSKLQPGCY